MVKIWFTNGAYFEGESATIVFLDEATIHRDHSDLYINETQIKFIDITPLGSMQMSGPQMPGDIMEVQMGK